MTANIKTATDDGTTTVTVEGLLTMTVHQGRVVIELAGKQVYVDRDVPANLLTIFPFHPRLAYVAPERRDEVAAELGLN
jgi:hypothetical protein